MSTPTKPIIHPRAQPSLAAFEHQLPQSLIIAAEKGVGGATVAQYLARITGTLIMTVRPTKRQPSGSHEIDMQAGTVSVDDIRELYTLTRSSFTTPHVVVIDTNGRPFSASAQNAFLKLLEEPPVAVSFIIAVHSLSELLPTIRSRCALLSLPAITTTQTDALLAERGIDDTTLSARLQFMARGKPAALMRLIDDQSMYNARVEIIQMARTLLTADSFERIALAAKLKDDRLRTLQLIDDMIGQLRGSLGSSRQPEEIARLIDQLLRARARIERYGNIPLQLSAALL